MSESNTTENKPTAYIFSDLGFGDSGKGATIDAFCLKYGIKTVVKYNSGPQSAHNVTVKEPPLFHTFSQYGSGTLSGAVTVLSEFFYVNPISLICERDSLVSKGVGVAGKMFVHYNCPIITPIHIAINRIKEQLRGDKRNGSCGAGHGEVVQTIVDRVDFVLRASDLFSSTRTYSKLYALQRYARNLIDSFGGVGALGRASEIEDMLSIIYDGKSLMSILSWYQDFINCSDFTVFFGYEQFLNSDLVFEGGQGILLDENLGFLPHATWTDTTPRNAQAILSASHFDGKVKVIGITRTFATRHGQGPLPSFCSKLSQAIQDPNNPNNTWQGAMRFGPYDVVTAAYVAAKIGKLDEIYLTHCDFFEGRAEIPVCIGYETANYHQLHIIPLENTGRENRAELESAKPTVLNIAPYVLKKNIEAIFGAKIVCESDGPHREDRKWI